MPTIARSDDLAMVGANGGGWCAPLGTAQPEDPRDAPAAPWLALGAISDDGLVTGFDEDSQSFTPWGLSAPFRTVTTSSVRTVQITLWETRRPIVRSIMYRQDLDDLVADENGIVTFAESATVTPDRRSYIFDIYDGDNWERIYIPEGEVTDRGDDTAKQDEMRGFEITITAYPDASNNTTYRSYLAPEFSEITS